MSIEDTIELIKLMRDNERVYFNMFQDGGAVCYMCNGMYLLFEVPLYGGTEVYHDTFFRKDIEKMVNEAYGWT